MKTEVLLCLKAGGNFGCAAYFGLKCLPDVVKCIALRRGFQCSGVGWKKSDPMQNSGTPKSGRNLEKVWNFKESFWGFSCRFRCIKGSTPASFDGALRAPSNATGELPRWRSRDQNLHDNSQSDSLKFHAFSTFLPFFGVQKSCNAEFWDPEKW